MDLHGKRIAITGVGGFIGLRMVERARERGLVVRGLDVSAAAARRAEAHGAEVIVADMSDAPAVAALCTGADIVFHTAATVAAGGELAEFRKVNVEGTRAVAGAARAAGVARFVHLSSVMVYGFAFPRDVDEDGPCRGDGNAYCITKIESEQVALAHDDPQGMRVVALRPGDVYGPGSRAWVVAPLEFMKKKQFVLPNGGRGILNHVHVDNLIDAVFLALERDAAGTAFNITDGVATTCRDFYGRLGRLAGIDKIPSVPGGLLVGGLRVAEAVTRLVRGQSPPLADSVRFLARPHAYSIAKARRVLGYAPRVTLDQGMAELDTWLKSTPSPNPEERA